MGNRDLPDIYALALGPAALGLGHIYMANPSCPCYNYYIYHFNTSDQRNLLVYISHINLWSGIYHNISLAIKPIVRWILNTPKFRTPFFSGQYLLLSTTVLNDITELHYYKGRSERLRGF